MTTVRDACQLQPNALSIKLSDQIEQLDELINEEGDGTKFFGRTAITQGMQDLITEGTARLAGVSNQAIFHLKQAMGGGKTHVLAGLVCSRKILSCERPIAEALFTPSRSGLQRPPHSMVAITPCTSSGARSPTNREKASSSPHSGPVVQRRRTRRIGCGCLKAAIRSSFFRTKCRRTFTISAREAWAI
jgi:hypothetical protein